MAEMIRIEGMEQVRVNLAAFDKRLQEQAIRGALHDAAAVMQMAVAQAAPVRVDGGGDSLPPGALKSDITLRVAKEDGLQMAIVQPGRLTRHVARWVEYGHRLVKDGRLSMKRGKLRGNGKQIGDVPAYPFIRPAFEASVGASIAAFVARLKTELQKRG